MCLDLPCPSKIVKDPSSIFKKENGRLVAWKAFLHKELCALKPLCSTWMSSIAKKHYTSNRKTTNLTKEEIKNREVYKGIHVYVNKPVISMAIIVKCLCDPKDFVAIEAKGRLGREAVFTKVELVPPKGYEFNKNGYIVKKRDIK